MFYIDSCFLSWQVSYGAQWFVHCIYTVRSKENAARGIGKRSISSQALSIKNSDRNEGIPTTFNARGTNMNRLYLDYSGRHDRRWAKPEAEPYRPPLLTTQQESPALIVVCGVVGSLLIIAITVLLMSKKAQSRTGAIPPSHVPTVVQATTGQGRIVSVQQCRVSSKDCTEV